MTASRASAALAAAVLTLAAALSAPAVRAQDGGPLQIVPPAPGAPQPEEGPSGIRVETLPDTGFESAGVLEPSDGGLGADLWAGTPREVVTGNLGQLPTRPASPTLWDVQRRLLLTPAEVPGQGLQVGHDLLTLRVIRLHAMGALDGLTELLDIVPPGERSEDFGRIEVDAYLAAGRTDDACAAAERNVRRHADPYFGRVLAVCHVLRGEADMAVFALGLLREENSVGERYLNLLAALQGDEQAAPDRVPDPSPLDLFMLHEAGRTLPAADLPTLSPIALAAVLRAGRQPPVEAAALAERAALAGTIPFTRYQDAMRAADAEVKPRSPQALEAVAADAADTYAENGFDFRLLVHASAMARDDAAERALVLVEAWRWGEANAPGDLPLAYATAGPLAGVEPAPDHAWFARDAARSLYRAGRRAEGDRWYRLLGRISAISDLSVLWPYAHLSDPGATPWSDGRLRAWHDHMAALDPSAARRQTSMLYAALDGLQGGALDRGDWRGVLDKRRAQEISATVPRVWRHARSAAFEGRRGEAILLAFGATQGRTLAGLDPSEVRTLVYILAATGLEAEARAVALEAFVAARSG